MVSFRAVVLGRSTSLVDESGAREYLALNVLLLIWPLALSVFFDVVEHLRQIYVEAIDYVSHHWSRCIYRNVIGVFDQLDVRRRCWNVGQESELLVIPLMFSPLCFWIHIAENEFGSSVLHIVLEPATGCRRYVGVEDTIQQLLIVHIVECSSQIEHCSASQFFS